MIRAGIRITNALLFTLCCFQAADLANTLAVAWLQEVARAPAPVAEPLAHPAVPWSERATILARNLFGAQLDPVETAPSEPIEKTELALDLLGTIASDEADVSMASVWNRDEREFEVLREGDPLQHYADVSLERIERKRVILRHGGELEELHLDDQQRRRSRPSLRRSRVRAARAARAAAARELRRRRAAGR